MAYSTVVGPFSSSRKRTTFRDKSFMGQLVSVENRHSAVWGTRACGRQPNDLALLLPRDLLIIKASPEKPKGQPALSGGHATSRPIVCRKLLTVGRTGGTQSAGERRRGLFPPLKGV